MARYNFLANANDGTLRSRATNPPDAQEGSGGDQTFDSPETTNDILIAGQNRTTRTDIAEYFQEFTTTVVAATHMVTSACYKLHGLFHAPSGDAWSLEIREAEHWTGTTLTTAQWVSGTNMSNHTLLAEFPEIRTASPRPTIYRAGTQELRDRLTGTSPLRIFGASNKQRLFFAPGTNPDEYVAVHAFESSGGPTRPRIEYSTAVKSSITRALAGETQLTDGTVVYLEFEADVLYLRHRTTAGAITTISTVPLGLDTYQFALVNGPQAFSLTRDTSNNLYLVGPAGAVTNGIAAMAFVKGSGYSWSSRFGRAHQLPSYDQPVNQVVATWHQTSGAGHLAIVASHMQGYTFTNQAVLCTVSANTLLNSTTIVAVGQLITSLVDIASQYKGAPVNATGTGLDICAISGGRGVIGGATFDHGQQDSSENRGNLTAYSYTVASNGTISSNPNKQFTADTAGQLKADGDMRAKVMRVSDTRFAMYVGGTLSAFTYSSNGIITNTGSNPWLMNSGGIGGLVAFPQVLDGSAAGYSSDALYDQSTGKVWIYYPDQANSRRIMRTGFNVNTGLLDLTEVQVATNTGASGSSNLRLRVPRGAIDERNIQIHLGNKDGGGVLSLVHVADTGLNVAPNAPVLNPVSLFSAGTSKQVTWVYSDNNLTDTQSAFQLQIRDQALGTSVLDTGKVTSTNSTYTIAASTLSNNKVYEWRVRTYDSSDVVGAYSAYSAFATTSVGVVEITDPSEDNPPGLASPTLPITWTFTASGLTQARYRVNVLRTDTGVQLSDTGFIAGADVRTYTVLGLITDVEQQIELRVEDNTGELTNTATRKITPIFSGPDQPTFTAQPNSDGSGIEVSVSNPTPTGDLPAAVRNDIYRSIAGENTFVKIGESQPNSIFVDYGVGSGTLYDYKVAAVAQGDTDSDVIENVSTSFAYGLYIHDPTDGVNTIRYFPYGRSNKKDTVSTTNTAFQFVGRNYPVFEFGDRFDETVDVSIVLAVGDTFTADKLYLRNLANSQTVNCYRDSLGRKVFGVITQASTSDEDFGSTVSFTVTRADFSEEFAG